MDDLSDNLIILLVQEESKMYGNRTLARPSWNGVYYRR